MWQVKQDQASLASYLRSASCTFYHQWHLSPIKCDFLLAECAALIIGIIMRLVSLISGEKSSFRENEVFFRVFLAPHNNWWSWVHRNRHIIGVLFSTGYSVTTLESHRIYFIIRNFQLLGEKLFDFGCTDFIFSFGNTMDDEVFSASVWVHSNHFCKHLITFTLHLHLFFLNWTEHILKGIYINLQEFFLCLKIFNLFEGLIWFFPAAFICYCISSPSF